ncbi:MAG TPA: methyltransferase domain-containing protein [Steroidobacteraceae bacterium]|nr:methyltransferase domain-containing protein [Steroidobacteraceae bacterium]
MSSFFHNWPQVTEQWLGTALGQDLIAAETELLAAVLDDVFGLELLQLGRWGGSRELLSTSRTRRQTIVSEHATGGAVDVLGRLAALPVQRDSVDAVLLPHTLEFESDPQAVVREADRVLTGEGQLIILGFRPWSLWGLRSAAARDGFPPGLRQILPESRLRDWLALLGYEVVLSRHYLYNRPWQGRTRAGQRRILRRGLFNVLPAGAYMIKARKHIYTLTPIRPRLRERRKLLGGLVEPTTRNRT